MGSVRHVYVERAHVRVAVDIPVALRRYGAPCKQPIMSDFSPAGAMLVGEDLDVEKGDEVILGIGPDLSVVATVAWHLNGNCGLSFHRRLHDGQVAAVLDLSSRATHRRGARLDA
jgi:hypothetical protein